MFGTLQFQVSDLQQVDAITANDHIDNESSRQGSVVKQFISKKIITQMKKPLSRRTFLCNTVFSALLRRHPLEISTPCEFDLFSHVALDVSRTINAKNTMFLPKLATERGAIGLAKQL